MIVCVIQDCIYLSWQAEILALNCRELGQKLTIISGWRGMPSSYARKLEAEFDAILMEDTRHDLGYAPSIQPHLLAKFVTSKDYSGGHVLLVDSDVLFRSLDWLPEDAGSTVFLSDCSGYLSSTYLTATDPDILDRLCTISGIDPGHVRNHPSSGGAQYLIPHLFDQAFWLNAEKICNAMYRFMKIYTCRNYQVQAWTASMWAILYEIYKRELAGECLVEISAAMDFCFATDPVDRWLTTNILHMAGVTPELPGHFFKGDYTMNVPWESDLSHVQPDNCSFVYVEEIMRLFPVAMGAA